MKKNYKGKKVDLQIFAGEGTPTTPTTTAETNLTVASDIVPEISIDVLSRLNANINTLRAIVSANEPVPMPQGSSIKMYKMSIKNKPTTQVGEGETITLTEVKRELAKTVAMDLKKYRKATTAEAIQKVGRDMAINQTDGVVVKSIQKEIKSDFFTNLAKGTGTATATAHGLQAALAAAWGKVQSSFEDIDATPIFFVSSTDVANYIATANVTVQTAFGMKYIENFLGLGDAFVSPSLTAGTVIATAKENLFMAYVPATGDVGTTFGMTSDETGLIAMTHAMNTSNATIETLLIQGVQFYAEMLDAVIKVSITKAS